MDQFPVTERALFRRIDRRLRRDGRMMLRKSRPRELSDLGRFYVLDVYRNLVIQTRINLEPYGRELGVLEKHETLAVA